VCASDEDALTLAWAACDRVLDAAGLSPDDIDGLWWGTSRPPFAEGPSWTHLAAVLRLGHGTDGALVSGSTHAGIEALRAAADAVAAGRVQRALVVTSDSLLPGTGTGLETASGAAAGAVLLTADGPASLGHTVTHSVPVLDRYRGDREETTREAYDGRLFREEVYLPLLTDLGRAAGASDDARWSLPDPDGRLGPTLGRKLAVGTLSSAESRAELGDTGAAAALVGIAAALGTAGPAVVMAYGAGRATAINVDVTGPVPGAERVAADLSQGREASYAEVLRARRQLTAAGESVEMAVPPGSAMFIRGNVETLGLLGARCVECGTVNTPPSIHPTCIHCGHDKFDIVRLARRGTVQTFVINHTMPAPFEAPLPLVVVDLDDGACIQLQGATTGENLAIGGPVELILRRYTVERGVPIYGWKVRELATSEGTAS
jgi:hydroxymethylglutaryl-CoA synthase